MLKVLMAKTNLSLPNLSFLEVPARWLSGWSVVELERIVRIVIGAFQKHTFKTESSFC